MVVAALEPHTQEDVERWPTTGSTRSADSFDALPRKEGHTGGVPKEPLPTGARTDYFRFGVCESALAAADFSTLVLFGFESTLAAFDAAVLPVCRVLRVDLAIVRHLPSASELRDQTT